MTSGIIQAEPHPFPLAGPLDPAKTAMLVIDMQTDFCGPDGMIARCGVDLAIMRSPIEPIQRVLAAARRAGITVVHTREGHAADLTDCSRVKIQRLAHAGPSVGDRGPKGRHLIRGEECWDIVPELAPEARETVIDKTGYGAFFRTNLEAVLRAHGVRDLIITGVTTDCCVNSTLRQCEDRGFDCLVLEDCCASPSADAHAVTIQQLRTRGIFGTVATSGELLAVLEAMPALAEA